MPPRFSSSYLSFCWLAAAAGTAGAAGIEQRNPAAKPPLLALLQQLRQKLQQATAPAHPRAGAVYFNAKPLEVLVEIVPLTATAALGCCDG
jgi:hypothetical protein